MAASRAPAEPYTTSFETTVAAVDGREVVLDETYFYPEGGGQPADRGTLAGVPVDHVREADGDVIHLLESPPDVAVGDDVAGEIDPEFRTYCMRAHTASHVLYGAARRLCEDLGYAGFDIGPDKVRVDLETPTDVDGEVVTDLERLANRAVWESRDVSWAHHSPDEALARDDVAFNAATEEGLAGDADVRVVTVEGWDWAACGGTHVANTREIGPVTVLDRSNPGGGQTRVEFAVGPSAIERRATERRASVAAADALDCGLTDLGTAATDLRDRVAALESDLDDRTRALVAVQLDALADGDRVVGAVEGVGPNDVGEAVRARAGEEFVAVAGRDGATYVVVGGDDDHDADAVVDEVTAEFGGGGGGSASFAQGGGLDADPDAVAAWLRDHA